MLVADEFLGTLEDSDVAARVDDETGLTVTLDDTERRRSRVRTAAEDGTDVGIVVPRELRDGDVLLADDRPVVVSLEPVEALVLEFGGVEGNASSAATAALELGHAVGNRHWDLAVEADRAYLPVTDSRERMLAETDGDLPDGVTAGSESVSPALFDDSTPEHDHSHGAGHSHDDEHSHDHGGDDGHSHSHDDNDHSHDDHGSDGHTHDHAHRAVQSVDPEGGDES